MGIIRASGGHTYLSAVVEERGDHVNEITEYPIEDGSRISTHAHLLPSKLTIEGVIIGGMGVAQLRAIRNSRSLVSYAGRTVWNNLVIKELQELYDVRIRNGAKIRVTFQQVQLVGSPLQAVGSDPAGG